MIRKAKVSDAKSIVYINVFDWKKEYKNIFPKEFLDGLDPKSEKNIKRCIEDINQYIVYELNKKVVGFAKYGINKKGYDDSYAEIYMLYIHNNYKQKGIGTKLVNYVFNKLRNKYKHVLISTLKANSANVFYKKIGGKKVGESKFTIKDKVYLENVYVYDL